MDAFVHRRAPGTADVNPEELEFLEAEGRLAEFRAAHEADAAVRAVRVGGSPERALEVRVRELNAFAGGHGSVVWPSAAYLAAWLLARPAAELAGRRVLELGAGCGLAGLAAALAGARVTLTDYRPELVANLEANIALNAEAAEAAGGELRAAQLDWGDFDALPDGPHDLVLAADVVYAPGSGAGVARVAAAAAAAAAGAELVGVSPVDRPNFLELVHCATAEHGLALATERLPVLPRELAGGPAPGEDAVDARPSAEREEFILWRLSSGAAGGGL